MLNSNSFFIEYLKDKKMKKHEFKNISLINNWKHNVDKPDASNQNLKETVLSITKWDNDQTLANCIAKSFINTKLTYQYTYYILWVRTVNS